MYIICTNGPDLQKIEYLEQRKFNKKLCKLFVQDGWICKKNEYSELRKFNGNLCTLCVRIVWICRKIEYPKLHNSTSHCVHYMYEVSGFVEKLNIQNSIIQ